MRILGLNVRAQLTRYAKNTSEGVAANITTQALIYAAGAAPAVLPAFFSTENIFSVVLAASVLTGIQFILQYPTIGDIRPQDSLGEEISRLRELIQMLVSARIVVRTDGGTQSLPRLPLPRYSLILIGSALTIPFTATVSNMIDIAFIIVVVGAVSSNLGDAIGMAAYQRAVETYDSEDVSTSTEISTDGLDFEFDDEEVTSNQEEILGKLSDIHEWLDELFWESEDRPFVVTSGRTEHADAFAERVSAYVTDATYEQFQSSKHEIIEEIGEVEGETSHLRSELNELSDEIRDRLKKIENGQATERQVEELLDEVTDMDDRIDSIETSLSTQSLDLSEFDPDEVREAFRVEHWSIVPGIGDSKEERLRGELSSIEDLQQASLGELEQIDGVGPVLAYRLKRLAEFAVKGK